MQYKLSEDWEQLKNKGELVVFGFGNLAEWYLPKIMKDFKVNYIIDNNPKKSGTFQGATIGTYDDLKEHILGKKIVIIIGTQVAENLREEIKDFLGQKGLVQYKDFCDIEEFVLEWYWRFEKKLCMYQAHTAVTTKCTLKCKKCNMFIPYYKEHVEYTAKDIEYNLDLLFQQIEYLFRYQIVGGEPFLNKDIRSIISLIGEKYGSRIAWPRIITNGTIVPTDDILELLKKHHFEIVISDYTAQVPYEKKIDALEGALKKHEIPYARLVQRWVDVCLPDNVYKKEHPNVAEHMKNCANSWHGLVDGKLYYCNVAWSAEKCGFYQNEIGDYIDLSKGKNLDVKLQEQILNINTGVLLKGYHGLCRYCKGCGTDNENIIPAGEQIKKHDD